jgi:hypothetical protein
MLLAMDFRRQARVCARIAEEYEDPHLASRLRNINTRTHGSISLVIIAFRPIDVALALELAG